MKNNQIVILGDICPDNNYRKLFDTKEYAAFSDEIVHDIKRASLAIGNLECPATNNRTPIVKCGPSLRANISDIEKLKEIGFDILSLANNHILDYGELGVRATLNTCAANEIQVVGAGKNCEEAKKPIVCELGGKKIGIISFAEAEFNLARINSSGANHFDPYESLEHIEELRRKCDYVIVLYHGGIEHYKYPSPLLQKKCRRIAKAGADLILCQHSHCIGTMEMYNDSVIIYGQGNSLFGYRAGNASWNEGLMVKIDLEQLKTVEIRLLKATPNGIEYADKAEEEARLREIKEDSNHLSEPLWIKSNWDKYVETQAALNLALLYGRSRVFNKLNRILHNKLIQLSYSKKKKMITMNLLRCEAHHEVVQTILENQVFDNRI